MSGLDKEFALYDFVPSSELLIFGVFLFEFYIELELQRLQSKGETMWSLPKGRLELKKNPIALLPQFDFTSSILFDYPVSCKSSSC